MEGNIAATYTLIYRFLKQQSQNKAAEAVKKAAKQFVVLRDDIEHQGSPLEDIIKEWRTSKNTKSEVADSSSEESESSDDSSSGSEDGSSAGSSSEGSEGNTSDSGDSSDDSHEGPEVKKIPPKGVAERDTSVTLSSAEENVREATKQGVQIQKKRSTKDGSESSGSDSSDSDSSGSDNSSKSTASDRSDPETSSNNSDPSSSSGSSDEDEASTNNKAPKNKQVTTKKSSSSSESGSDCEDGSESEKEDAHVVKKRKTSESGAAAVEQVARYSQKKEKPLPKVRERFQRVKIATKILLDNGYEARGGASNDYGQRAHHDLVVTRGAGFRKEKNKKKRGSYRGGEITMENHSIKFDF